MCGIAGILAYDRPPPLRHIAELDRMTDRMARRGPDGSGKWSSPEGDVLLGHRRLAIIDPTPRASQPMTSRDGRHVIIFNGEIYNHVELRQRLKARGHSFATASDTEVILALYCDRGALLCSELQGMFAFALYDMERRTLLLARDPYGIKPLYYSQDARSFRFASQVKALAAGGGVDLTVDPAALAGFGLFGHVPEPFSFYSAIKALPAGCMLTVAADGIVNHTQFASVAETIADAKQIDAGTASAVVACREALRESVARHMVADVDLGLFLSGGVDSGALLGMMCDAAGNRRLHAVTLAFDAFGGTHSDEGPLAGEIAAYYGCSHQIRRIDRDEFEADTATILSEMDQPSIDGVNTWFVAKAAREAGLKVALSGLGGDELLGGYSTFRTIPTTVRASRGIGAVPGLGRWLRKAGAAVAPGLRRTNPKALAVFEYGGTYPGAYLLRRALFLPHELPALLGPDLAVEGLRRLEPLALIGRGLDPDPQLPALRVATLEATNYLRNQLLRDADWAGMAHSVEIRTPFVDHTLLKAVAPYMGNLRDSGKRVLAGAPLRPLGDKVVDREKTGFSVPMASWSDPDGRSVRRENNRLTYRGWAGRVLESVRDGMRLNAG